MVVTLSDNSRRIDVDINLETRLTIIVFASWSLHLLTPTGSGRYPVWFANAPRERQCNENWQQEGWKEAPVPVWNMLN